MNLATATRWWNLWLMWPPRTESPLDNQPQGEERTSASGKPLPQTSPQHTENLLTSIVPIPGPLKKGRGLENTTLSCTINKFHCTQQKGEREREREREREGGREERKWWLKKDFSFICSSVLKEKCIYVEADYFQKWLWQSPACCLPFIMGLGCSSHKKGWGLFPVPLNLSLACDPLGTTECGRNDKRRVPTLQNPAAFAFTA